MKTVLVTGASSGIGEAIARRAAIEQWKVIVGYRSGEKRANLIVKDIIAHGGDAITLRLDLESPETLEKAISEIVPSIPTLDALILCASAPPELVGFTKLTPSVFLRQLTINAVSSQVLIAQIWKTFFRSAQTGHVVGILSQAMGSPPWNSVTAYVAAKRALASVLESAAAELGRSGLRISAVSPHYTSTPMSQQLHPHIVETMRSKAPGGRFLTAHEVADQVIAQLNHPPAPGHFLVDDILATGVTR